MKKLFIIYVLSVLCGLYACSNNGSDVQTLNQGWNLKTDTLNVNLQVNLPSEAHAELYAAGIIPHPYSEDGEVEAELQWIPQRVWDYSLKFNVDKKVWANDSIDLIFKGLDTYADVWLNGVKILHADNMFVQYHKEVKQLLKKRGNELKVRFYPFDSQRDSLMETYPLKFPEKYAVMRKAAYQNGWDWAPRYLNVGIWKDVELRGWNGFMVENLSVVTKSLNDNEAEMSANIVVKSATHDTLKFVVVKGDVELGEQYIASEGDLFLTIPFTVQNPQLWWPNEMGEQTMTDYEIDVYRSGQFIENHKVTTGIRSVELVEEYDDTGGSMYFKVNGKDVYIKGANYVPEEMIETWMTREKTLKLLMECKDYHFNMLRVWGGGIYPPDYFYEICDSLGIMVWQDFMFAGTTYPYSDEFFKNVKIEAKQQVLRYQSHPSLAMWCGNNEVSEGFVNWGWQQSMGWSDDDYAEMQEGMENLFDNVLNNIVYVYDGTRPYWPSSPKNGWGRPESLTEGDVHYWGVWWGEEPYEAYLEKVGRFNSEFGYQAYPNIDTKHQKHPRGEELIEKHVSKYVRRDVPWRVSTREQYIYYSQLSQVYGIGLAIEAQRAAKPRCMGTLYWQLNDAWPVISWSSIDYEGNKKALHWKLKDLYAPIIIGVLPTPDGNFKIYANSDYDEPIDAELELDIYDFDGRLLKSFAEEDMKIPANGCVQLPLDVNLFVGEFDKNEIYIKMQLIDKQDKSVYAERIQYLAYPKDLKLKKVDLQPIVEVEWGIGAITFISETLVKDVYIEFPENSNCSDLSDNFFDIEPNVPKYVTFNVNGWKKGDKVTPEFKMLILNNLDR